MRLICSLIFVVFFLTPLFSEESPSAARGQERLPGEISRVPNKQSWPHWDGKESIEAYARRTGLPARRTFDLGDGVKFEMVLIPAGKFEMGSVEPEEVNTSQWDHQIIIMWVLFVGCILVCMYVLLAHLFRAWKEKAKLQVSLARFIALILLLGISLGAALEAVQVATIRDEALKKYQIDLFDYSLVGDDEKPAHAVTLSRPFYLASFETTQLLWKEVVDGNPSVSPGDNLPVDSMDFDDVLEFLEKLSLRQRHRFRLPTEAEWEFALRAGTTTKYSFGTDSTKLSEFAWAGTDVSRSKVRSVGKKLPNAWGLYDMNGNLWEWCQDWYGSYSNQAQVDPVGPGSGDWHSIRGGSWMNSTYYYRSSARWPISWGDTSSDVGFRIAMDCNQVVQKVKKGRVGR